MRKAASDVNQKLQTDFCGTKYQDIERSQEKTPKVVRVLAMIILISDRCEE